MAIAVVNSDDTPASQFLKRKTLRLLIDGKQVEAASGKTFETINPATGEVIAHVAEGDAEDIDRAVRSSRKAFEGPWSKFTPQQRQMAILKLAGLIDANFEEFAMLDTLDMGVPYQRQVDGKARGLDRLYYIAGLARAIQGETIGNSLPGEFLSYTIKEPVGVVGGIIPWNGPLSNAIVKIGPTLASGCTMILKPAEQSPLSALRLGELILEAGIPEGVINVVTGFGETAGAALAAHMDVDKVAFTGSPSTGQAIVRASAGNLKKLALELGGKSPNIIFADADLAQAIPAAGMGVFANTGQNCAAGTRLFVEESVYEEFMAGIVKFARDLKVGNGLDPATQIGPLVSKQQLDRVSGYLESGKSEGARAAVGGDRLTDGDYGRGYFVPPTVFTDVRDDMKIAQEEIFGPVLSVLTFREVDEVVRRANSTHYGLASGVWTRDISKAHHMAKALRAGSVWMNAYLLFDAAVPFGGFKMSGYGREFGQAGLDEYLHTKSVWLKTG